MRRQPTQILHSDPFRIYNLDFEPRSLSIQNTTPFVCYLTIGGVNKPSIKAFDELIPPFTGYIGDPAGARSFAVFVDNTAAPNTPFTFPVVVVFSEGSASVQAPLSQSLVSIAATGYDGKLINVFGASLVAFLPLEDLSGLVAVESVAAQNWAYGASNVSLNQAGIGDGKTSVLFGGAAAGQVTPPAPVLTYLNGSGKFNKDEGSISLWLYLTSANAASATVMIACTIGVDANNFYKLYKPSANTITMSVNRGGAGSDVSSTYNGNAWVHLAATWSVIANRRRFYVNGTQFSSIALAGTWAGALTAAYSQLASANNAQYLSGYLAKFALGNRELSQTEVTQLSQLA